MIYPKSECASERDQKKQKRKIRNRSNITQINRRGQSVLHANIICVVVENGRQIRMEYTRTHIETEEKRIEHAKKGKENE